MRTNVEFKILYYYYDKNNVQGRLGRTMEELTKLTETPLGKLGRTMEGLTKLRETPSKVSLNWKITLRQKSDEIKIHNRKNLKQSC